ncbi:MAG: formate dehydrogenase accessory sulfurtransferase FdhD [Methanotrichaceae archaeon]|nr:formate dehydrogenase accessory sulfurtransferase FdhD [Methanotrichaceae archaeon]
MFKEQVYLKLDHESAEKSSHKVVDEVPLSIFVNGRHFVTAMISPQMINEFVLGHIFSEGIIKRLEEVESLEIEENIARLIVRNPIKAIVPKRPIVSGCGGNASYMDGFKLLQIKSDFHILEEDIFSAMKTISSSKLHEATGGVHSVGLFDQCGTICIADDIGRHNALDKVIGHGLNTSADFGRTFVASTGRISSDMALKCSLAGIPIVASRGATTILAIAIAKKTGLTIIGFVRGRRMNVYTSWDRIDYSSSSPSEKNNP